MCQLCVDTKTTKSMPRATAEFLRHYHQWIIRQFMDNIDSYKDGFLVRLYNGEEKWLLPVFCLGKTDWPEGQTFVNMMQGASQCYRNCRVCLTPTVEFSSTERGLIYERREQKKTEEVAGYWREQVDTQAVGAIGKKQTAQTEISQYFEESGFVAANLYCNRFGIHSSFPMDILHTVPHGLVIIMKEILLLYAGMMLCKYLMAS